MTSRLIKKYGNFFRNIIVCGTDSLELDTGHEIVFKEGNYDPMIDDSLRGETLVVIDDLTDNKFYMQVLYKIFTRGRHKKISCIFITQNLYLPNKEYRSIALNANYFILFKIRDIKQVSHFSSTFIEREKQSSFISCYRKYVLDKDYGYLLIDFSQKFSSPLMIRTNLVDADFETCIKL